MTTRQIKCQTHGGTFMVESKRGRPPVKCTPANACTRAGRPASRVETTASRIKNRRASTEPARTVVDTEPKSFNDMTLSELREYARYIGASSITRLQNPDELRRALKRYIQRETENTVLQRVKETATEDDTEDDESPELPEPPAKAPRKAVATSAGLSAAKTAKQTLTDLGWDCKGRAADGLVTLLCTRNEEMLTLTWEADGTVISQEYKLFPTYSTDVEPDVFSGELPFNPADISDEDFVRTVSGMRVVWWNSLAKTEENAIMSSNTIRIMHTFAGNGTENLANRVVTFVEHGGRGFRSFRLGALLRINK